MVDVCWGERKHRGVDLLECCMPESWLDWHQTKYFQDPTSVTTTTTTTLCLLSHESHVPSIPPPLFSALLSLSLSLCYDPRNRRAAIFASSDRITAHSAPASGQTAFLPPALAAVAVRLLHRASGIDL